MQVTVTDRERSRAFYGGFLGLPELQRPTTFHYPGAWFQLAGEQEPHIVCVPDALWREPKTMEIYETPIALRVPSFRGALERLHAAGFHENLADEDPRRIVIRLDSPAGYPQVYFFDPDRHLIEWNAAVAD